MQHSILIVDDDRFLCDILSELLSDAGYAVESVNDGEAAWAEIQSKTPDVVLSDIKMPKLGGVDLASRLISGGYPTPIILMSAGYRDWADVSASFFIRKPFDFDDLLSTIAITLDRPSMNQTTATA